MIIKNNIWSLTLTLGILEPSKKKKSRTLIWNVDLWFEGMDGCFSATAAVVFFGLFLGGKNYSSLLDLCFSNLIFTGIKKKTH